MAARYEVHITRTPLGLGIHEEDTLVKVSGAMTGDEVITQGVRCGDILLKVSTSYSQTLPDALAWWASALSSVAAGCGAPCLSCRQITRSVRRLVRG